jgi:hypothetical protein
VSSRLDNPFDDYIEEAILEDMIPYSFEVSEFTVNGETPTEQPEQTRAADGIRIKWTFKDIPPKTGIDVQYDLRRRVSRTILLPMENQLKVIKTHSSIHEMPVEGLFSAMLKFQNQFGTELRGVVIEDIIPLSYVYEIRKPDEKPHFVLEQTTDTLVQWQLRKAAPNQATQYEYQLLDIARFEEMNYLIKKLSAEGLEALKNGQLGASHSLFDQCTGLLKNYM